MLFYLEKFAIRQKDRILFCISLDNDIVGHIGLSNITETLAELDNVIRGAAGYRGMMTEILDFLLEWANKKLGVSRVFLRVVADNSRAIEFYKRAGFQSGGLLGYESNHLSWIIAQLPPNGMIMSKNLRPARIDQKE